MFDRLTARERQVARAVARGHSNREIARGLGVKEQTVKNHLSAIYAKLGVRNRLALALEAHRAGLAPAADDS